MLIPLLAPQGEGYSKTLNAQRTVNLYPVTDPGGKAPVSLYGTPGTVLFATCGTGPIRGMLQHRGVGYVVSGNKLYSVTSGGVATEQGTLTTSTGAVSMECNGLQIVVGDGSGYVYDIALSTFAEITDGDFPGSATWAYLDGYGIFNQDDAETFYITSLLDFTGVDALDFASAESLPDTLVRVFADHGELWLFGSESIEIWQNTGAAAFPFERLGNTRVEKGLAAKFSVAKVDNTVFWLGSDGVVYRADGYLPTRISTEQVETSISGMDDVSDAEGFTYDQDGHKFYVLTFPGEEQTWVYDVATQMWHERTSADLGYWRARGHMQMGRKQIVGDSESGKLFELSTASYTDDGAEMIATHILPAAQLGRSRNFHYRFELEVESGVGLVSGLGSDPQIILDWSDDGGHTWSNELSRTAGAIGEYGRRAIWNRLGVAVSRNYRIKISDPVKRVIIAAHVEGMPGAV